MGGTTWTAGRAGKVVLGVEGVVCARCGALPVGFTDPSKRARVAAVRHVCFHWFGLGSDEHVDRMRVHTPSCTGLEERFLYPARSSFSG